MYAKVRLSYIFIWNGLVQCHNQCVLHCGDDSSGHNIRRLVKEEYLVNSLKKTYVLVTH